jgi:hypothetical protein
MVKTIGPLFSLDARGQIGKTLIYAKHGDTNYAKAYNVPTNPRSTAQTLQRTLVRAITRQWASLSALTQASWLPLAAQRSSTAYHAYLWYNLQRWNRRLLPVPTPVDNTTATVNDSIYFTPAGIRPNWIWQTSVEQASKPPYVSVLAADLSESFPGAYQYLVALVFNPNEANGSYEFNGSWTAPDSSFRYTATIVGYEDGDICPWTYFE